MNESILKALIRLFAIVADVNRYGQSGNERSIVKDYLDRQYSHEIVNKYIDYFDEQVKFYHPELMYENERENRRQNIYNEAIIIDLCNQINEELEQQQKLIVLIYLLDFINRGDALTENEIEFVTSLAYQLNIHEEEFQDAKAFTFGELGKVADLDRLLFIDSNESSGNPEIKHMPVEKMEGRIVVLYLPSTNTYVFRYYGNLVLLINGHNIKPNRSYIWSTGSNIKNSKIGSIYFSRMSGRFIQANIENKFVFLADNIEFSYRNSNNGIKRFTFNEESGRLVGIIGGSGSGKSTLLNVLNGSIKLNKGSIKINGYDINENKELLKGVIGFVPQDDLLIKELTTFQNLYYNARLCFSDYTEQQIVELVELALVDFDLVEARDLNVGDSLTTILSGGQRKRLNIALELIREPSILFVDEPTSGLSSADSEKVITLLKRQALKGKLVITNIHQPSSDVFKMFDKLLVMDQGGRIIFYGNPVSAVTYFKRVSKYADADESECLSCGNINADQILRIVEARVVDSNGRLTRKRKTSPDEWYQIYMENIDPGIQEIQREHDDSVPKNNFKIPGHFKQFKIFLERDVFAKLKNTQYLYISALEAPLLALILAFFTKNYIFIDGMPKYIFGENQNFPAFLFMAVIVSMFMGLVISAEEIFKDRRILKREKFLDLSRGSYLFSKISILFAISAIQTLIFILITNYMLEIRGMGIYFWIILFTASCWANLAGLIISSGLNSVVTIYILVPLILVPQMLLSGVVVDFDKMHNKIASQNNVPLIGDFITCRWAYEALMVSQFKYNKFEKQFYPIDFQIQNAIFYKSYGIPELNKLLNDCEKSKYNANDSLKFINNLNVIKNEIDKIYLNLNWAKPEFLDSINAENYHKNISNETSVFLDKAENTYIDICNQAVDQRDNKYNQMVAKLGGDDGFQNFKEKYYNRQLADFVTNARELKQFNIHDGELVRIKDAVFRMPESQKGRAHFYAPFKRIYHYTIDTFWFNLLVIWLYCGLLFVLLYFDVLRKVIYYFETIRLNRRNRLRILRLLKVYEQFDVTKKSKK
jgi:ABC-type multidrug transport system ATPase subunit